MDLGMAKTGQTQWEAAGVCKNALQPGMNDKLNVLLLAACLTLPNTAVHTCIFLWKYIFTERLNLHCLITAYPATKLDLIFHYFIVVK